MVEEIMLPLIMAVLVICILAKSIFEVKENQRLVVLRLGKFEKVIGPGFSFVVPFTDMGILVELNKHLPEWQTFSEEELCLKVTELVKKNPEPKAFR